MRKQVNIRIFKRSGNVICKGCILTIGCPSNVGPERCGAPYYEWKHPDAACLVCGALSVDGCPHETEGNKKPCFMPRPPSDYGNRRSWDMWRSRNNVLGHCNNCKADWVGEPVRVGAQGWGFQIRCPVCAFGDTGSPYYNPNYIDEHYEEVERLQKTSTKPFGGR